MAELYLWNLIEQNRTKFQSNIIVRLNSIVFGNRTKSDTTFCEFDYQTKSNIIELNRSILFRNRTILTKPK